MFDTNGGDPVWDPWPVTYERAMEILEEWEEFFT